MKRPDLLIGPGTTPLEGREYAVSLARRTDHPIGLRVSHGTISLFVLDTPELLTLDFDRVVYFDSDVDLPDLVVHHGRECESHVESTR